MSEPLPINRFGEEGMTQLSGTETEKKMALVQTLLLKASHIMHSMPSPGEDASLRWRIYQLIQAQEGHDDAAFYKEMRCAIHLGVVGECSNPITLGCGHSFCKTCIAPFYFQGTYAIQRKCPTCRSPIKVSYDELKPNVSLMGIVEHILPPGLSHDQAAIAAIEAKVIRSGPTALGGYSGTIPYNSGPHVSGPNGSGGYSGTISYPSGPQNSVGYTGPAQHSHTGTTQHSHTGTTAPTSP